MKLVFTEVYFANLVYKCSKLDSIFNIINFSAVEDISDKEQEMGFLVMDALTLLLNGNSQNAGEKMNRTIGIITVRNNSCGKVMFSQASVTLSTGGVVYTP